jgi:hypothetical protein
MDGRGLYIRRSVFLRKERPKTNRKTMCNEIAFILSYSVASLAVHTSKKKKKCSNRKPTAYAGDAIHNYALLQCDTLWLIDHA